MPSHVERYVLCNNLCSEATMAGSFLPQVQNGDYASSFTSGHAALSASLPHLLLDLPVVSQPMPHHSLSNWQIWNNKTTAETTTTRCFGHPSLHAIFDKPDTLETANCLTRCYSRPSSNGGPPQCFFLQTVSERLLTTMLAYSVNRLICIHWVYRE